MEMKRFVLVILALVVLAAGQVWAQDANTITLSDSNPSVSASIDLPVDTTGVVTIDLSMALVTMTDANGSVIFSSVDPRVHHLELSIAPNSGIHTLTIQRLPGAALASAQISSQANLTPASPTTLVDTNPISLAQQQTLSLDASHPTGQVALDIQPNTTGLITAQFPGVTATSQLTDASGALIATSSRDIDGFNAILDGGRYDLSVQTSASGGSVTAGVSVTPTDRFTLLSAPQAPAQVQAVGNNTSANPNCTASITGSSVNLRSGPGTGYSVLNSGSQGDHFAVGGINPEQNWVVVGTDSGSAWVSRDLTQLDGDCAQLRVFDIPLRNAQAAPVIVQTAPNSAPSISAIGNHEDDHFEGFDDNQTQHSSGDHEGGGDD